MTPRPMVCMGHGLFASREAAAEALRLGRRQAAQHPEYSIRQKHQAARVYAGLSLRVRRR